MAAKCEEEMVTTDREKDDFIPEAEVFQEIEDYFRKSDEILQQQKLRELVDVLRRQHINQPENKANRLIHDKKYEIEFEDSDTEGDSEFYEKADAARNANDKKFLNIIIPTSEAGREKKKRKISEKTDIEVRRMAFETFMDDYSKKMNLKGRVEHNTEVVKTQEELEKVIKDFVKNNKADYGTIFINLMCHGSEDGKIATYDKDRPSNNVYVTFLDQLAIDENVPIQAIMGQCFGYKFDKKNITMGGNLSVYATTDKDNERLELDREYIFYCTVEINGKKETRCSGVEWAKHEGFTKYVEDEVNPPSASAISLNSNNPTTNLSQTDGDEELAC